MQKIKKNTTEKKVKTWTCPKCGRFMYAFRLGYKCSNKECTFWIPREIRQKVLTDEIIRQLVEKRETGFIQGFHKRGYSQTFGARLYISDEWKIKFRLHDEPAVICPKCNSGMMVHFERGYRCEGEEGCGFIVWNRFAGKELTDNQMVKLLTERKTDLIKGFVSKKNGRRYSARIVMNAGGALRMDFDNTKGPNRTG